MYVLVILSYMLLHSLHIILLDTSMNYKKPASKDILEKTVTKLNENGFSTHIVLDGKEALKKVKELVKEGSSVMTMTSVTLDETGISEYLNESGKFDASKPKMYIQDSGLTPDQQKLLGYASDYTLGSVHAVTSDGVLVIASNTGSQLGAYAYGGDNVIFVVGAQKIVDGGLDEALKRVYDYVLPLESERAQKAYGVSGSNVSKLLVLNREIIPDRTQVIIVQEQLGF